MLNHFDKIFNCKNSFISTLKCSLREFIYYFHNQSLNKLYLYATNFEILSHVYSTFLSNCDVTIELKLIIVVWLLVGYKLPTDKLN